MKTAAVAALGLAMITTTDALSMGQVASLWKRNGGSSSSCPTAVAVAWAESHGNPKATGRNSDSYDRGLWQINSKWHPDVSDSCAYNAGCNAKNAVRISKGGSRWSPWATYNHGRHRKYMSKAKSACASSRDELSQSFDIFDDDTVDDDGYLIDDCFEDCRERGRSRRFCQRRCRNAGDNVRVKTPKNKGYWSDDDVRVRTPKNKGYWSDDDVRVRKPKNKGYWSDDDDDCFENCRERGLSRRSCRRRCRASE